MVSRVWSGLEGLGLIFTNFGSVPVNLSPLCLQIRMVVSGIDMS